MTIQTMGSAPPPIVASQTRTSPGTATVAGNSAVDPSVAATGVVNSAQLSQAVEAMRQALEPVARNLEFSIDNDTGETVVRVVDMSTQEVIRQIPTKEALEIAKSLDRLNGLFVKNKA